MFVVPRWGPVVVDQIEFEGVPVFGAGDDPPVAGYGHAPVAREIAFPGVAPESGQVEAGWHELLIGTDATRGILLEQALKTLYGETTSPWA
jgi:hypothetical protein